MWSRSDVFRLFSINVGPFSSNVVLSGPLFSSNLVPKQRMFLGQAIYVLGPLQLANHGVKFLGALLRTRLGMRRAFVKVCGGSAVDQETE